MQAEQLLREGDIQGALRDIQEQIRKQPDKAPPRVFLFQLLSILGDWGRALNQLNVLGEMEKDVWPLVHLYRGALQCEVFREEVFAGRRKPLVFGEPPPWMALLLESLRLVNEGHFPQAVALREQAFEQATESAGYINEQPFSWLADADTRLGPVLEIIINGRYYWAPMTLVSALSTSKPEDLRDLVWLPAQFTWVNGGQAYGLLPVRYPGSQTSTDPAIQMSRKTEWRDIAEGVYQGLGQRMLATDQAEYPLLEVRSIYFK
ncbi:MAG: virulence protein SciE type [Gemmatimonadales bacterium]|nr:MAG: virulence protein SciE type [Gemmatimonadales bacterium]